MEAKFSLTWHSYSDQLKGMMKEIMASGDFADVTLICDGREQIKAHKNILAACSPVLKEGGILIDNCRTESDSPSIYNSSVHKSVLTEQYIEHIS